MRVLHLIYDHPDNPWVGGGGAVRAFELNRRLVSRGHSVLTISGAFPDAVDIESHGVEFRFMGRPSNYLTSTLSYARAASMFARECAAEFDVVVEDFAPWNPAFTYAIKNLPSVLHVNHREGLNLIKRRPILGWPFYLIEKYYPARFNNVTALSQWTRRKIGVKHAFVLPAGIGEEEVEKGALLAREAEREDYVVFLGRLEMNNKGLDTLIGAVRMMGKDVRLLLAGRGRDEARLREMAKGLPVEFLGFIRDEEKVPLLSRARALVLPSRFEGWGIAVLEAAAYGTPVVVSDIPELSYALEGGYGVSFRTADAADLACVMGGLLKDDKKRAEMGNMALEAAARHTWRSVTDMYEKYLEKVIVEGSR